AEATIVGVALGMALGGEKPIACIQDGEFLWLAMHQIREIARLRAPAVLRVPYGVWGGNPAAALSQFPQLQIFAPSQAADAKFLLAEAINDHNPVIFLEHRTLWETAGPDYALPASKAAVVRQGSEITVVTWGAGVAMAQESLVTGRDLEILDLRLLAPI